MSLRNTIRAAVSAAVDSVRDLMLTVEWNFVSSDIGSYNPTSDTFAVDSIADSISVLPYADQDDDDKHAFSSRGNFVELPTAAETIRILMTYEDAKGSTPSTRDFFMIDDQKWIIFSLENVYDIVYLMRARRV